jgi:hypothetical protein
VARGGAPGPASDVFGVAAAAFHALTGIAPWNAATPADTLRVAADGLLPDLAELAPEAPPELLAVIGRGLAADPHDRGSAAAFALDLRHACRPEPVRLPQDGVPDAELGATGRGPRTELTHQVPGRRPRPAPVVSEPVGRGRQWWSAVRRSWAVLPARRIAAVGLVVLAVSGVGWLALRSAGPREAGAAAATPSTRAAAKDVVDRSDTTPVTLDDWRTVVDRIYQRRAAAFGAATAQPLDDVYVGGSALLASDVGFVTELAEAGEVLRGFAPRVERVTAARADGDRAQLDLVDGWDPYEVAALASPDGPALRTGPGRAAGVVHMVLVRTGDGWRIESAERRP